MPARVRLALIATAGIVLVGALAFALLHRPTAGGGEAFAGALRPEIPAADFALRDQDGRPVRLRDYRGRVTVLTFLYSTCRDTCPVIAQQIAGGLDRLGHDVPALAVSVDPANDTPARARRFLVEHRVAGRLRFLLGPRERLAAVWRDYGIRAQGRGFEHSAYVVLLDRRGRQRVSFPVDKLTPEGLAHDLRLLEAEPASGH